MKIFDFNVHLPTIKDSDVNVVIESDLNLRKEDLQLGFDVYKEKISKANKINILLFNTKLFEDKIENITDSFAMSSEFTALIDFRRLDLFPYLEKMKQSGVKAIMFNSYLQKISELDFFAVLKACKFAEEKNIIICIDGSFGTTKMYTYDNIKLISYICEFVKKVPIVIIHSGGKRILDAMLIALEKKNVWLDTSFSLPFYIGSSVETDYAYAYKKIGCSRILYGSDHPYLDFDLSLTTHLDFFQKHKFLTKDIENIFFSNAMDLFHL